MYRITCDGFPLLDLRDDDLILADPKVNLEVNTVGEGSFTIYKNHPHFDKLTRMRSVFEVSDDTGVIFRGRATGDTVDFDHGKMVDLEGAMAYFNDSILRRFNYPDDFQQNPEYVAAEAAGKRVEFFLKWLIQIHNVQVQDFQKMKLGVVTVNDPNFTRSNEDFVSTWEILKSKLFESTLGGYLCIRYEEDGNYIDYLADFDETNGQEIVFGENLLDLKNETEASEIYTAIIPVGALGLTIDGLADRDLTSDIVKFGDTLYSRKGVAEYGWIYAPVSQTTWEEVVDDADLQKAGVDWLAKGGSMLNAIEVTAVDLHFTDAQAESLRIYKNVTVHSDPHGLAESFPLTRLEIDLLNPQNTKIIVGKTIETFTEQAALLQEEAKKKYSKLSKTDEQIKMEVVDEIEGLSSEIKQMVDSITLSVSSENGSTTFTLTAGGAELSTQELNLTVDAMHVSGALTAATISADKMTAGTMNGNNLNLDGLLTLMVGATAYGSVGASQGNMKDIYGNVITTNGAVLTDATKHNGFIATNGGARVFYGNTHAIYCSGDGCCSTSEMKVTSDARMKNSISYDFSDEERLFPLLKPCSFAYNRDEKSKTNWGFIAQDLVDGCGTAGMDVEKLAFVAQDENGIYSVATGAMVPINTHMIQKLMERVAELETKLEKNGV